MNDEVTYSDFAKLAHQRHWTIESLAARFRGKIDEPREFFSRVLKASGAALLPYRSVIDFYEAGLNISPRSPQLTNCALGLQAGGARPQEVSAPWVPQAGGEEEGQ